MPQAKVDIMHIMNSSCKMLCTPQWHVKILVTLSDNCIYFKNDKNHPKYEELPLGTNTEHLNTIRWLCTKV